MPIPPAMQTAIDGFFQTYTAIGSVRQIASDGHTYELYVYCQVVEALSGRFTLIPLALGPGGLFNFRCNRGPVDNSFNYFACTTAFGNSYQVRNGIEVQGHNLAHEIDVGVFHDDGSLRQRRRPNRNTLRLALECKFYKDANALKGEVRKYLGLMSDLSDRTMPTSHGQGGCVHLGLSFYKSFVTNVLASLRPDIQAFINAYTLWAKFGILPGSGEEEALIRQIQAYSRRW